MNQFDELVEDGHAAHDALLKIFTKKIKLHLCKSWLTAMYFSVGMASMQNVVFKHMKAQCIRHSLACQPRVYDVQALNTLLTCKLFDAYVTMIV